LVVGGGFVVGGGGLVVGGGGLVVGGFGVEMGPGLSVRVSVICGLAEGETAVEVEEGRGVAESAAKRNNGVVSTCMAACTVKAETVFRLETAKSTILPGSRTMGVRELGLDRAIAEVIQSRLMPRTPAATTPRRLV
jgi:hypothetical protein